MNNLSGNLQDNLNVDYSTATNVFIKSGINQNTLMKISKYLNDIENTINHNSKINKCLELYMYLTEDPNCIKLLRVHDTFIDTCIKKFERELIHNIDKSLYIEMYNKLQKIKLDNRNSIMTCNFSNNGKQINNINI